MRQETPMQTDPTTLLAGAEMLLRSCLRRSLSAGEVNEFAALVDGTPLGSGPLMAWLRALGNQLADARFGGEEPDRDETMANLVRLVWMVQPIDSQS